jgi:hypothetical protein
MLPKQGLRIIVTGEHVGALPATGQQVLIRTGDRLVHATVDFLMRSEKREAGKVTGYSWALTLRDVTLHDVPIGSIITYPPSDPPIGPTDAR